MKNKIFSCANLDEFIKSIKYVLNYKGYSESKFFVCEIDGVEFFTKLAFYKKTNPELYNDHTDRTLMNPSDAEIAILNILKREIIEKNVSPCILELLYAKKCPSIKPVSPEPVECVKYNHPSAEQPNIGDAINELFCDHISLVKNGLYHKQFSWLILEECDLTLRDYILKFIDFSPIDIQIFKSIMFQIIYTMHALNKVFPDFTHGDLHTENIMLKFDTVLEYDPLNTLFLQFDIDGEIYSVPYFGIICKIIDFGFASIPSKNIMSFITMDKQMMFARTTNDILLLFHDIVSTVGDHSPISDMLAKLEPTTSFITYSADHIRANMSKINTCADMIQLDEFSDYKKDIPAAQVYHRYKV